MEIETTRRVLDGNSHTKSTKINCHILKLTILTHSNSNFRREKVRKTTTIYIISITNVLVNLQGGDCEKTNKRCETETKTTIAHC